jgi:hypothetical protein
LRSAFFDFRDDGQIARLAASARPRQDLNGADGDVQSVVLLQTRGSLSRVWRRYVYLRAGYGEGYVAISQEYLQHANLTPQGD